MNIWFIQSVCSYFFAEYLLSLRCHTKNITVLLTAVLWGGYFSFFSFLETWKLPYRDQITYPGGSQRNPKLRDGLSQADATSQHFTSTSQTGDLSSILSIQVQLSSRAHWALLINAKLQEPPMCAGGFITHSSMSEGTCCLVAGPPLLLTEPYPHPCVTV